MSDLRDFLLARIAEDEEFARDALDDEHDWRVDDNAIGLWPDDREPADGYVSFPRKAHARHAAIWSPARVLADCEARRQVVEGFDCYVTTRDAGWIVADIFKLLAMPYAQHPHYRQEWRP